MPREVAGLRHASELQRDVGAYIVPRHLRQLRGQRHDRGQTARQHLLRHGGRMLAIECRSLRHQRQHGVGVDRSSVVQQAQLAT